MYTKTKTNTEPPQTMEGTENNESISYRRGLKCILLANIFALDSVVVKIKILLSLHISRRRPKIPYADYLVMKMLYI